MRKAMGLGAALLAAVLLAGGCGDALPRGVEIVTEPPGAVVHLGHEKLGVSPVLVPRKKIKDHHLDTLTVVIEKEGYKTRELVLSQHGGVL